MVIEISGNRCIGCRFYTQHYIKSTPDKTVAIDHGFCGRRQQGTRPGNRCKYYAEKPNLGERSTNENPPVNTLSRKE